MALLLGTGNDTRRAGKRRGMCRICMHDRSVAIADIGGVSCNGLIYLLATLSQRQKRLVQTAASLTHVMPCLPVHTEHLDRSLPAHRHGTLRGMDAA
ncbi:hypothetical protein [Xanthomonas arboricola]|uniref:hypothetical protein n=1 Tax=Xanthomonas arboricola TaxID=56448 RepID=UPI00141B1B8A|nr:hypothetical protein [Xanthomonas arboricola]NIK42495.1 hypothetical protein [Xanthomonas arboricola]